MIPPSVLWFKHEIIIKDLPYIIPFLLKYIPDLFIKQE